MAYTKTSIISLAISLMGHKPIQTLDNADDLVISAEQAFDVLLPAVLSTGNWRFAVQIAQLSQLVETPPTGSPWTSVYQLPSGYLRNMTVWPINYQYDIYENRKIYSCWSGDMWMEYAFVPDVSKLPPLFVNYFVFEIAAFLALSNAEKPEYFTTLEAKRIQMQGMAAAAEAQNRPNYIQVDIPVLTNRMVGTFIGDINA